MFAGNFEPGHGREIYIITGMKRLIFYLATLRCMNNILFAKHAKETVDENQTGTAETERIFKYFSDVQTYSAEKLCLHLNQPYYAAGDTVWFRAYLVNAMIHCPDTLSNFLYVDLFDRKNSFVLSRKIDMIQSVFQTVFPFRILCPQGNTP